MERIQIAPSILSADLANIEKEVKRIEKSGADAIHVDIMDGQFVPNITFGPVIVAAMNRHTNLFLDVHLMIYEPDRLIEPFVKAGADRITVHYEATETLEETLEFIRSCGIEAGVSFRPETSMSTMLRYIPLCDSILIMTVNPGFSGQEFMPEVINKISFARECARRMELKTKLMKYRNEEGLFTIQVDGGINKETLKVCAEAGANSFVSGSFLFNGENLEEGISLLRKEGELSFDPNVTFEE